MKCNKEKLCQRSGGSMCKGCDGDTFFLRNKEKSICKLCKNREDCCNSVGEAADNCGVSRLHPSECYFELPEEEYNKCFRCNKHHPVNWDCEINRDYAEWIENEVQKVRRIKPL